MKLFNFMALYCDASAGLLRSGKCLSGNAGDKCDLCDWCHGLGTFPAAPR
jgi:hypothetical protein